MAPPRRELLKGRASEAMTDGRNAPTQRLAELYPHLAAQADRAFWAILERAKLLDFPSASVFFREGEPCDHFMWVLAGAVRVLKRSEEGRELTLFRVTPGEVCISNLNQILHGRGPLTEARADEPVEALVISGEDFREAMDRSPGFRQYVLGILTHRLDELTGLLVEVSFYPMDSRLASLLGQLFERSSSPTLTVTHDTLAQELGTSREVVSRNLKKLEHAGCIRLQRGRIQLQSSAQLARLAFPEES